ncbi:MAG: TcpQ domain-containing protein [Burkholderiaceae bacterium]|nr:TcpQ domain-containing protein [Burkholderiaceae bacterium]
MHTAVVLVAVVWAACLASACGFVPPAPPKPSDAHRIAINRTDPRLHGQEVIAAAPAVTVVATPIPSAGATPQAGAPEATPTATPAPVAVAPISVPPTPELVQKLTRDAPITPIASATPGAPLPAAQSAPASAAESAPAASTLTTITVESVQPIETLAAVQPPEEVVPIEPPVIKRTWHISPSDGTVRQALMRWAGAENWTFGADQWELNFDLPIEAQAEFQAESFQQATQALSQAIAMTESPVRPCFYANRVLRMIPFTRSRNRALAPATAP